MRQTVNYSWVKQWSWDEWNNDTTASTTNKHINIQNQTKKKVNKLTKQFLVRPIQLVSGFDNVSILWILCLPPQRCTGRVVSSWLFCTSCFSSLKFYCLQRKWEKKENHYKKICVNWTEQSIIYFQRHFDKTNINWLVDNGGGWWTS